MKKENPFPVAQQLFSIIIPCYGKDSQYLPDVFLALSESSNQNFEVILVFDGPNPAGAKKVTAAKKMYPSMEITSYAIPHGGAPAARNFGATYAKGEFYVFLDSDSYLYPETLQMWNSAFEEHPEVNRVWGLYEISYEGKTIPIGGSVPVYPNGKPDYYAFRFSNYCDSSMPIRKNAYVGWDESVKSLQDWEMNLRMLKTTDFKGDDWLYLPRPFYLKEPTRKEGISDDSHQNWIERVRYVKQLNNIPESSICVVSHGAPHHGMHIAKLLNADYLPQPMYKPNNYKMIYLVGFYTNDVPNFPVTKIHMDTFAGFTGKKVIHWIGSDVLYMHWKCSFAKIKAIKEWMVEQKIVNLTETRHTQDEMAELGIATKVIPIPPQTSYEPLPLPEKFTVGIYESAQQKMYGEELMVEVARSMPDIEFKFFGDDTRKAEKTANTQHLGFVDMKQLMPQLSCNVRISVHDGLALTAVEFMEAGRNVIHNYPIYGVILAKKDRKEVIEAIRKAQNSPLKPSVSNYWIKIMDTKRFRGAVWNLL